MIVKLLLEHGATIDQKSLGMAKGLEKNYPEMLRLIKLASDYDKARASSRGKEFIMDQFHSSVDKNFLSKRDSAISASMDIFQAMRKKISIG